MCTFAPKVGWEMCYYVGVNGYKTPDEKKEEEEASIPVGFEDIVDMYPMDFEEWLWANGIKDMHIEYLKTDIFGKMGRKLYYYHKDGGVELDFLIRYKGDCAPVECKATTGNAKSIQTVLKHPEKYHVTSALKLGDYNIGRMDYLLTLPMYMAFLLKEL